MTLTPLTVLLVGGTGSIGRNVANAATRAGHRVRILTRNSPRVPSRNAEVVTGDLTDADTLTDAGAGIDAVVPATVRADLDCITGIAHR